MLLAQLSHRWILPTFLFSSLIFAQGALAQEKKQTKKEGKTKARAQSKVKSSDEFLSEILAHYQTGEYTKALDKLEKLKEKKNYRGTAHYWMGLTQNKLQHFDEAIAHFEKAQEYQANFPDLSYEYGQAAYASFKYQKAYQAFARSAALPFRPGTSYYYMGFINVKKENYPLAIEDFKRVLTAKSDDSNDDVKQAASFQLAQIYLLQAERSKKTERIIQRTVLPQLEEARAIDPSSNLAKDIIKQTMMIKQKYGMTPGKMNNGRAIPEKLSLIKLTQASYYNSNVINEAGAQVNRVASRGSAVSDSTLLARKRYNFKKRYVLSPELTFNNKYFFNRNTERVKQNDQYNILPGVEGMIEHKLFGHPASFITGVEYNHSEQNRTNQNARHFFSRMYTYTLGEAFHLFAEGDFTFKAKYKYFVSYDPALTYDAWGFTGNQSYKLGDNHVLGLFLSLDRNHYRTNKILDSRIYVTRLDYFMSEIFRHYKWNAFFAMTLTDNLNQPKTRGVERKWNPGTKLSRNFMRDDFTATLHYAYTRQQSRNKSTFDFEQYITGLDFAYKF